MLSADGLGILFALTSALVWGSGDFSGGLAARRSNQFQVLALSALSGILMLLALAVVRHESLPSLSSILWAILAGASGAVGIATLYRALSLGNAATVAPAAGVVGAALPVVFGTFTAGLPGMTRLTGFILALLGIRLVSKSSTTDSVSRQALSSALLAGGGFGGFFILIAQVEPGVVFTPLIVARCALLGVAVLMLLARGTPLPSLISNPTALVAGMLDAGGNVFYLVAKHFTRLDVVVVLASLYPAATMLLARIVLKEKISRAQWLGAAVCLTAIGFIVI
jgi:drug/metabolite transporter (DMT)-like permease